VWAFTILAIRVKWEGNMQVFLLAVFLVLSLMNPARWITGRVFALCFKEKNDEARHQ
jgi:hypothetical protein